MIIIIIALFCELLIGGYMSWYFIITNHKIAAIVMGLFTIAIIIASYNIMF